MSDRKTTTRGLFVVGTDTGVGKTYLTSLIARQMVADGVHVGVYKPVCSGGRVGADGEPVWDDIEKLSQAVGPQFDRQRICPQRFSAALAPPVAARREGKYVDGNLVRTGAKWWNDRVDLLLVEGVGGLLCPLTEDETVADFAADLGFPLIIVSAVRLGAINHTLLTIEVAQKRGLRIAGVVLNAVDPNVSETTVSINLAETNLAEIESRCDAPVLGVLEHDRADGLLRGDRLIRIDWLSLADRSLRASS